MVIKDAEIKVRLKKDQKELIKKVAKAQGMSMSEFMVTTVEKEVKKIEGKTKFQKIIEDRAMRTEEKLIKIAERIRGNNFKKSPSKFMFWVGKL